MKDEIEKLLNLIKFSATFRTIGKRCMTCKWLLMEDNGYSNYTVESTDWDCLKNKNPLLPAGDAYSNEVTENANLLGAACSYHTIGDPVHIDVDTEGLKYEDDWADPKVWVNYGDEEQRELIAKKKTRK